MADRAEVAAEFARFDSNGDGTITRDELAGLLQAIDPTRWDDAAVDTLFEAMDSDNNDEVTVEEFLDFAFGESAISKEMREIIEATPAFEEPEEEVSSDISDEPEGEDQEVAETLSVGDFVKVQEGIEPSHKWGKVKPGMVGVVATVAGVSCTVNFPTHKKWRGECSEMEKVDIELAEGDTVRVRPGVDPPKFKWGKVVKGEYGTLTKIMGVRCRIDFVSHRNWLGILPEIEKVPESERQELAVGDHVRVKEAVKEPRFKWGTVVPGEVGSLVEVEANGRARIVFRSSGRWLGFLPELEKVPAEVGWRVRVRADVDEPSLGWEGVERQDVGAIEALEEEGRCRVNFGEKAPGWVGLLSELEFVPIVVGDQVRVKPNITKPKCGWGRVKPEDVGELVEITRAKCKVDFPRHPGWKCFFGELERVDADRDGHTYPAVGSKVQVKEEVKEPKFKWGRAKHGLVGELISASGLKCKVQFSVYPQGRLWTGWLPELEEVEGDATDQGESWAERGFVPGRLVKVRDDVDPPRFKWGKVKPGQHGRIREVVGDTGKIEFAGLRRTWMAYMPEMELVLEEGEGEGEEVAEAEEEEREEEEELELFNDGHAENQIDGADISLERWLRPGRGEGLRDIAVGQMVKVKDSVERPKCGWGAVRRGDEGELKSISGPSCRVAFERQKNLWNGRVNEMEAVNASMGDTVRLFGELRPQDLKQGRLGDCWLIAALAALAEFPDAVRLPFSPTRWSKRGRYKVRLFCLKSKDWKTVCVDDRFAVNAQGGLYFTKLTSEGELWPALLEKAVAVLFGGYQKLAGGWGPTGWAVLTGCELAYSMRKLGTTDTWKRRKMIWKRNGNPSYRFAKWSDGKSGRRAKPTEELLDMLVEWDRSNFLMCASAHIKSSDSQAVEAIVQSHEYSLLSVFKDVAGSGFSLLKLRNPWGRKEWKGAWSDLSAEWNEHPEVKETLDPHFADDGIFWMSITDFARIYDTVCVLEREMPPKQDPGF